MSPLTIFLSKLLGLYCLIVGLSMFAHKQVTVDMITALVHNAPATMLASVFALGVGLAIVLSHNVWSGGGLPVVVTLVGWIGTVKGLLLLFLSPEATVRFFEGARYGQLFYLYAAITFLLGAYLTYGGFTATKR